MSISNNSFTKTTFTKVNAFTNVTFNQINKSAWAGDNISPGNLADGPDSVPFGDFEAGGIAHFQLRTAVNVTH